MDKPDWISLGDFIVQVNLKMEDVNIFTIKMPWSEEIGVQQSLFKHCDYTGTQGVLPNFFLSLLGKVPRTVFVCEHISIKIDIFDIGVAFTQIDLDTLFDNLVINC